jgi:signal transduction histidine kinase
MVVLAFLIPLSLTVRDLARDQALTAAQNQAEAIAQLIALRSPGTAADEVVEEIPLGLGEYDASILLSTDQGTTREVIGAPVPAAENLEAAFNGASFRAKVTGGQAFYAPVLLPNSSDAIVVRVFVPDEELTEGVGRSSIILALLGTALILIAIFVADRLGRSMVEPVRELSATAAILGEGNLDARVTPSGPPEVQEVALELNDLADRIVRLLRLEREAAADLSHRLRTPLTALRLDAEALPSSPGKERVLEDLDDLDRTVDFVIREARRPARTDASNACNLTVVARDRVEFWSALAEEQERTLEYISDDAPAWIAVGSDDASAMIDALVGNVFAHTEEGIDFTVAVAVTGPNDVLLVVDDQGPGFSAEMATRGSSSGGSTGLGLDIATNTARAAGGKLEISSNPDGGGRVAITLPLIVV